MLKESELLGIFLGIFWRGILLNLIVCFIAGVMLGSSGITLNTSSFNILAKTITAISTPISFYMATRHVVIKWYQNKKLKERILKDEADY